MRSKAVIPVAEDKGHPLQSWFAKWKGTINRSVFIVGLLLCILAVWRIDPATLRAAKSIGVAGWSLLAVLLMLAWVASVAAWRQFVQAVSGRVPDWRSAFRQNGLLLIGKYLPGGVFGFLARLYDDDEVPRSQAALAGGIEQFVGLSLAIGFGGILYLSAMTEFYLLLATTLLLPLVALVSVLLVGKAVAHSPWLHKRIPDFPALNVVRLLTAAYLLLLVQILWAGIASELVQALFGIGINKSVGIAGSFGLSVAAGMLVFVMPGGIIVREGTMIALMSPWLGAESALLLAAILRLANFGLDIIAGVVGFFCRRG